MPIPKAANPLHIKENLNIFDFQLTEEDRRLLKGIKPKDRLMKFEEAADHPFYPFEREDERDRRTEEFEKEDGTPKRGSAAAPAEGAAEGEEAE